jgi:hypothetical protein
MSPPEATGEAAGVVRVATAFRYFEQSSEAAARVAVYGRADRVRRAVLGLLACWGAACAAVFLPVLHFVLVPSLLIAGPWLAFVRLGERRTVLGVEGPCPACGGAISVRPGGGSTQEVRCDHCRRSITWSLVETPAGD